MAKLRQRNSEQNTGETEGEDDGGVIVRQDSGDLFKAPARAELSKVVRSLKSPATSTRSASLRSTSLDRDSENNNNDSFPKKPVRTSFKDIDRDIIEVMVTMESSYNVEQRKVAPLLAYIMNKLAGQCWEIPTEDLDMDNDAPDNTQKRKRKEIRDLTFVLPSRNTLRKKLEDASLLNFQFVAQSIQNTHKSGGTVTSGWDDTLKASGHRLHDVKTGRITCTTTEELSEDILSVAVAEVVFSVTTGSSSGSTSGISCPPCTLSIWRSKLYLNVDLKSHFLQA